MASKEQWEHAVGFGGLSTHEDFSRRVEIKLSADRTFGLVFGTFFALIAVFPVLHGGRVRWWALGLSGMVYCASLVKPSLLNPLNRAAKKLSEALHRVVSPVVAGLFFFVILTPIALLSRAFRKDPLHLLYDAAAETYWVNREQPGPSPESMGNQF